MKLVCAWCIQEGNPSLIGEQVALVDEQISRGICPFHAHTNRTRIRAGLKKVHAVEGQFRAEPQQL